MGVCRPRIRSAPSRLSSCALAALAVLLLAAPSARASFHDYGLEATSASLSSNQAGRHSDFETRLLFRGRGELDERGNRVPWANLRRLTVELPPGLVGNPGAFPTCDTAALVSQEEELPGGGAGPTESCSPDSQVGVIEPGAAGMFPPGAFKVPLVNLAHPPEAGNLVARFGFEVMGITGFIDMRLDSRRDYAVTATLDNAPGAFSVTGAYTTFWGVPTDHSHDYERFAAGRRLGCESPCSQQQPVESGLPPTAFLGNPTGCGEAEVGLAATSYEVEEGADYAFPDLGQITACSRPPFEPSISLTTTTPQAAAPSGLDVNLEIPQSSLTKPNALRSADLKEAAVTLPEGVSLNASSVDGLGGCSQREIGVERNERQILDVGARGAPVVLSLDGQASPPLPGFSSSVAVSSALEALPGVGPGNVAVTGRPGGPWTVDFGGGLRGRDVPPVSGVQSEMQQLVVEGGGGSYRLVYDGESTVPIDLKAQSAEVQSALEELAAFSPGDVSVSGGATSGIRGPIARAFDIAFEGSLSGADIDALTAAGSVGIGILEATTLIEGGTAIETHTVKQGGSLTFDEDIPHCPDSSKVATGVIETPMVASPISASIYLADQGDNTSGSTYAGYLVAAGDGLLVKMPALMELDPVTGRVHVTFSNIPQLPLNKIELHFKGGDRGVITTPPECGTYDGRYELTPWSDAPPAVGTTRLVIDGSCHGNGLDIGFRAGSTSGVGGAFSSFHAQVTRSASSEPVKQVSVDLPPGMAARLAGVGRCPDAAFSRLQREPGTGGIEASMPVCPADSQVGSVEVGMGSGLPFYPQSGKVYLTGPYRGAPIGLALVMPALAGPFDLGNVLVRVAVSIDPETGRVHAESDPFPTLLQGVPLQLRDLRILLDRPGFMINPTSCGESAVTGAVSGPDTTVGVTDRFELGDCANLGFNPQARLSFGGVTARNGHPSVRVELVPGAAQANIARASVSLPAGELLDLHRIRSLCDRRLPPERCPSSSKVGSASLWSPLIDAPLEGPIYLRSPSRRLPDLLADLRGDDLHLLIHGHLASSPGRLRLRVPSLPDYPFSKAVLSLSGGAAGLFVNSESLCAHPGGAEAAFIAHNGRSFRLIPRTRLAGSC